MGLIISSENRETLGGYPVLATRFKDNEVLAFDKVKKVWKAIALPEGSGGFEGDLDDIDEGTTNKHFTSTEKTKLSGIENNATKYPDTGEEVYSSAEKSKLAGIEANATKYPDTGEQVFTDALKTKLDGIEAGADVTDTANVTSAGALMDSELTDLAGVKAVTISTLQPKPSEGAFANGDKTKLDGIETGATKYPDTGEEVYSSAEKTKLAGIAAGAEVNVNPDWNSSSGDSQILNKPTIPTLPTIATGAEVDAGTNNTKMVTPLSIENSSYMKQSAADATFEDIYIETEIADEGGTTVVTATNSIIYINIPTLEDPPQAVFFGGSADPNDTERAKCIVKVIAINTGLTQVLDFNNELDETGANIELTDANNGSAFMFVYFRGYWRRIF